MMMNEQKRTDRRTLATRKALIDAAESLFAKAGIDGVSLRQIGAAIGSSNNNVVAYHFGDKEALVIAIFRTRLTRVDQHRADLLEAADSAGRSGEPLVLLDCLCRPLLEQVDSDGKRSFAAFIDAVLKAGRTPLRATIASEFAATNAIVDRLAKLAGTHISDEDFIIRLHLALAIMIAALRLIDHEAEGGIDRAEARYAQSLTMLCAATFTGETA